MKDKRILLCCNRTLGIGGIEKALTTFVKVLDTENNDITLALSDSNGELFQQLPTENIRIVYTGNIDSAALLKDDIRHFRIVEIVRCIYNRIMLRLKKCRITGAIDRVCDRAQSWVEQWLERGEENIPLP